MYHRHSYKILTSKVVLDDRCLNRFPSRRSGSFSVVGSHIIFVAGVFVVAVVFIAAGV
jgi:hypothetical protein